MKLLGRTVIVNDDRVEQALRKFKKKIAESGLLIELRERETYIKPTTRRKVKKAHAGRSTCVAKNCLKKCTDADRV